MNDWGKSVLNQYELDFDAIRRGKGVLLCSAHGREYCLQPFRESEKRLPEEAGLLAFLSQRGHLVDSIVQTADGSYIARNEYQDPFILRLWHPGEECVSTEADKLIRGAEKLASLHLDMVHVPELVSPAAIDLEQEERTEKALERNPEETRLIESMEDVFARHSRELKKIQSFVKRRKQKTPFEELVAASLSAHMEQAAAAAELLMRSGYQKLLQQAVRERRFIHGSYNYHYVYLLKDGEAVVNFSRYAIQVQILDLYEFLRKSMEKNAWDQGLGERLIGAYHAVRPISGQEMQVLAACLLYPEKYWKQLNTYYNSNKAWIPLRSQEKLTLAVEQSAPREKFVKKLSILCK